MSTVLETVVEYEERALDLATQVQEPALDYLKRAVDFLEQRLPEERFEWPENLPAPTAVVESQFAFAKKLLTTQEEFTKKVVQTLAPLTGETISKPRSTKSTKSTKAAKAA